MRRIDYDSCKTEIKGVSIELNEDKPIKVTGIPKGMKWDKYDRELAQEDKKQLFTERYEKVKGSVKRDSLAEQWGEVALIIMKYITYDG